MASLRPEARTVDQRLRVLDAQADRKGLGFEKHPARVQHRERVARAVADREHDVVGADFFAAGQRHPAHVTGAGRVGLDQHVLDPAAETDLAAERLDRRAHRLDHPDQPERADMRLADVGDLLGRAGFDELGDDLAAVVHRVADLAPQLAVGERARATLAVLHVRLRVEDLLAPQPERVDRALAYRLAALQDDRPEPHLREQQPGEQPARPGADHDRAQRPVGRRVGDELVGGVGGR